MFLRGEIMSGHVKDRTSLLCLVSSQIMWKGRSGMNLLFLHVGCIIHGSENTSCLNRVEEGFHGRDTQHISLSEGGI